MPKKSLKKHNEVMNIVSGKCNSHEIERKIQENVLFRKINKFPENACIIQENIPDNIYSYQVPDNILLISGIQLISGKYIGMLLLGTNNYK